MEELIIWFGFLLCIFIVPYQVLMFITVNSKYYGLKTHRLKAVTESHLSVG